MQNLSDKLSLPSNLLTAEEVGQRLRLPLSTVYYLAKTGQLPAVKFGRSWRFPATSIERLKEAGNSHRIMVVDDDAVTRAFVTSALEPCGCKVWEAGSVEEALQYCSRQKFDAFFIDLKMPGRDGTELVRDLLGEYSLTQMVVITSHPDISEAAALLELGPITLLRKPLSVPQLIECARRMTGANLATPEQSQSHLSPIHGNPIQETPTAADSQPFRFGANSDSSSEPTKTTTKAIQ